MVRIISQNFSPQRSRHSSGETDRYLAERASSALGLSLLAKKRFDLPECESSSDSFWDSELDGEHHDAAFSEHGEENNDINGNETLKKSVSSLDLDLYLVLSLSSCLISCLVADQLRAVITSLTSISSTSNVFFLRTVIDGLYM